MSYATIKSYPNGIALHLDANADFEEVIAEIETKFEESRKFFKNSKVALSIEDRIVNEDEQKRIIQAIKEHSDLDLICLVGKNEETNRKFVKALKRVESQHEENNARFYYSDIDEGDIVECDGTLVVFGDIKEGSAAVAKKNIIVFGSVFGQAYAGDSGDENSFVFAFNFDAKTISINKEKQAVKSGAKGFGKKKYTGTFVYLEDGKIAIKQVSEEIIRELLNR